MRIYFAVFIVSWVWSLPSAHAVIRFNDGNQHTITEDVDEPVVVTNQTEVLHRGTIASGSNDNLVEVSDGSKFTVNQGRIEAIGPGGVDFGPRRIAFRRGRW